MIFKNEKLYNVLKWIALTVVPAITLFLNTVLPVWDVEAKLVSAITTTTGAVGLLIGALVGVSSAVYHAQKEN